MKRLIVANWKMNLTPRAASLLVSRLDEKFKPSASTEVVLCPPAIDLPALAADLDKRKFKLGAQNIHQCDEGPFTGEISAPMLKGLASYVIIGHSERRAMGETDKVIAQKMAAAIRNGLTPILCIGENLQDREHKLSKRVILDQLTTDLSQLTPSDLAGIVIAYEPVWSINHHDGHPVHATPSQIEFAYPAIRGAVEELYGEEGVSDLRLLYGGSTDPDHSRAYLEVDHVEGLLVGTASLNYEDFAKIIKTAQSLA